MSNILKDKKPGAFINLAAAVFALVALIAYSVAGQDSYGFVPAVAVLLGLGIIAALVFTWHDFFEFGPVVTMAFFGAGFAVFLNSRFMYFSHQYYGIASDPITAAMIVTVAAFAGMIVLEIVSAFMRWEGNR